MVDHASRALAAHLGEKTSISLDDVRKLRREMLPDGLTSREEAELLIAVDRAALSKDPAWEDFLVDSLVEFVVWTSPPTGYVDAETADWLISSLNGSEGPAASAMRVVFEIVREAEHVDEALLVFALRSTHGRTRLGAAPEIVAGVA